MQAHSMDIGCGKFKYSRVTGSSTGSNLRYKQYTINNSGIPRPKRGHNLVIFLNSFRGSRRSNVLVVNVTVLR